MNYQSFDAHWSALNKSYFNDSSVVKSEHFLKTRHMQGKMTTNLSNQIYF